MSLSRYTGLAVVLALMQERRYRQDLFLDRPF